MNKRRNQAKKLTNIWRHSMRSLNNAGIHKPKKLGFKKMKTKDYLGRNLKKTPIKMKKLKQKRNRNLMIFSKIWKKTRKNEKKKNY